MANLPSHAHAHEALLRNTKEDKPKICVPQVLPKMVGVPLKQKRKLKFVHQVQAIVKVGRSGQTGFQMESHRVFAWIVARKMTLMQHIQTDVKMVVSRDIKMMLEIIVVKR